jgi:cobaltochelatase CobN
MHVLATELATLEEADVAIDLGQSPAEVVLSFSDSDLSALAAAWQQDADVLPTMRPGPAQAAAASDAVDLYVESVVARARIVIALPGGSITGATASSISPTWRATMACCSRPCRVTTARSATAAASTWPPTVARLDRFHPKAACESVGAALRRNAAGPRSLLTPPVQSARSRFLASAGRAPGRAGRLLSRQPDGGGYCTDHLAAEALDRQGLAPLGVVRAVKDAESGRTWKS